MVRAGTRLLHRWAAFPALSVLLPADCFGCGRPLGPVHRLGACLECWSALRPIQPPYCTTCGLPLPPDTDLLGPAGGLCVSCLRDGTRGVLSVRAAVVYDGLARRFLLRAKFGDRPELLRAFGEQLARLLVVSDDATDCTVAVPVPSHPWIRLRRGFDPAAEVAGPVARTLGIPLGTGRLSRRLRAIAPTKRMRSADRRRFLGGAFRARMPGEGARVLLVDDVITTGATVEACARALQDSGADAIRAVSWARTPPGRLGGDRSEPSGGDHGSIDGARGQSL